MGTHDKSIDQISWESSQENIASACVADSSSSEWDASEQEESASSASSADRSQKIWLGEAFEDVLALHVSSPGQGARVSNGLRQQRKLLNDMEKQVQGSVAKDGEEKALYSTLSLSSGGGQNRPSSISALSEISIGWIQFEEGLTSQSQLSHSDLWTEEDFQDFTVDKSAPSRNLQEAVLRTIWLCTSYQ